ncbi:unnamed protein product [Closterium sp. NIES-64]|nr:unnamed protein product [Closterium sp. NIES-64]
MTALLTKFFENEGSPKQLMPARALTILTHLLTPGVVKAGEAAVLGGELPAYRTLAVACANDIRAATTTPRLPTLSKPLTKLLGCLGTLLLLLSLASAHASTPTTTYTATAASAATAATTAAATAAATPSAATPSAATASIAAIDTTTPATTPATTPSATSSSSTASTNTPPRCHLCYPWLPCPCRCGASH